MTIRTLILALMLAASTATLHLQIPFPTGIDCTGPDKPAECDDLPKPKPETPGS